MKLSRKPLYILYILIIFGFVILINYHANQKIIRADLTENQMYTIDPATKSLLNSLSDLVTIDIYFSEHLPVEFQKMQEDVKDIVTEFQIYGGDNIAVNWRNPKPNSIDRQSAESNGIQDSEEYVLENDRQTRVRVYAGVAVTFAGRTEILPRLYSTENFEYELIKRISMVLRPERPRIGFFRTDAYTDQDVTRTRYGAFINVLEREFTVDYIDVLLTGEIDPAIDALIVPGGDDFYFTNPYAIAMIDQYFMKGGKLIVLANKIDVNLSRSVFGEVQNSPLFDLLKNYGVEVEPRMIIDTIGGNLAMQQEVDGRMGMYERYYPLFVEIEEEGIVHDNPAFEAFAGITFHWASPLKVVDSISSEINVDTLVMTSPKSYAVDSVFALNPRIIWDVKFARAEEAGMIDQFPIVMHLSGNFKSLYANDTVSTEVVREVDDNDLIVIGNSNFIQGGTANSSLAVNTIFMRNLVDWFTVNDGLISIRNRTFVDRSFVQNALVDENRRATTYRVVNILLMPSLLILVGLILFIIRKKAQKGN